MEKLAGLWALTREEANGEEYFYSVNPNRPSQLTFRGNKFVLEVFRVGGPTIITGYMTGTITVDESPTPPHIDLICEDGIVEGKTLLGIYKLEDDKLTICLHMEGGPRPTEFTTTEGSQHLLYELKRDQRDRLAGE